MSAPFVAKRPWAGFVVVTLAYVAGLAAAALTLRALPADMHPFVRVALADVAATAAVFLFSVGCNNSSMYDAYWSVAPVAVAGYLAFGLGSPAPLGARGIAVLVLISLWGARLTFNWARGWAGLHHEDWRYVHFRKIMGRLYWPVSFVGIHLFPTLIVLLGCLPLYPALVTGRATPFGALDAVAVMVTLGAIALETVADEQLRAFRQKKRGEGDICDVGVWGWSRHPNYLGEIGVWLGLWLFGVAAGGPWWIVGGVVAMVALFLGVSIPIADKRSLERRPAYAEHKKRVPALLPRPRRAG